MAEFFYVRRQSQVIGPLSEREVVDLHRKGRLTLDDEISGNVDGPWVTVKRVGFDFVGLKPPAIRSVTHGGDTSETYGSTNSFSTPSPPDVNARTWLADPGIIAASVGGIVIAVVVTLYMPSSDVGNTVQVEAVITEASKWLVGNSDQSSNQICAQLENAMQRASPSELEALISIRDAVKKASKIAEDPSSSSVSEESGSADDPSADPDVSSQTPAGGQDIVGETTRQRNPDDTGKPDFEIEDLIKRREGSVAILVSRLGNGSGVVVGPGIVATNRHVVEDQFLSQLKVVFHSLSDDERGPFDSELIFVDDYNDVALIRVSNTPEAAPLATDNPFNRGREVVGIGSPAGINDGLIVPNAISRGTMSAQVRLQGRDYFQLDISINPGQSGGPVFDRQGRVVGLMTLKSLVQDRHGFCLPASKVLEAMELSQSYSNAERRHIRDEHRNRVVVSRIMAIGDGYLRLLYDLLNASVDARNGGRNSDDAIRLEIAKNDDILKMLMVLADEEFLDNLSEVTRDPEVETSVREKIINLWENCQATHDCIKQPLAQNLARYEGLLRSHQKHTASLRIVFRISRE